ncbi:MULTISPECIES: GNAT family N-acetyltransferase [Clostridium]|uniref:GNAT family N-acetyltransferase n=1 Tax=Clostridium TaxID=1485 RepID=UPI0013E91327|nr:MULTISPECIES: GNAT family N-acetyltransferase [Clostridium]MBW9158927.1 GNAT family N-acetyltransferase [Clostridium tagluense]MBZ9624873.1 GNAT family N-acetyltransferase [Clostridium sp. FP2]MBZ9636306.1 GNAT family N-acetyltransferase [Clostridium sp. FP1]WLC64689.1 GNAT family N-acetyltransferase [Clostridium tagluense]
MIYTIKDSKRKHMLEAYDKDNKLVGEAVISPFMDSDLAEKPRLNIYIDIKVTDVANKTLLKDQMFDEIMKRARAIKEENKDIDVRVYHCCFSDNKENIAYYSSKEGFKYDEGMHIIKKELTEENFEIADINGIDFVKLELIDEDEIIQLVEKQNKVFNGGYSLEDLKKLRSENQWLSIAAKHEGVILGNIIIIVKENESNTKYGWVDDLFVSKEWRNRGIGKNLILRAFECLKALNIKESSLEVWSANKRALSVYNSLGYTFYEETESSIGMFL